MPKGTNLKWVPLKDLDDYPMGKIDRQIAKMIVKQRFVENNSISPSKQRMQVGHAVELKKFTDRE
jgi:hypothetical protein